MDGLGHLNGGFLRHLNLFFGVCFVRLSLFACVFICLRLGTFSWGWLHLQIFFGVDERGFCGGKSGVKVGIKLKMGVGVMVEVNMRINLKMRDEVYGSTRDLNLL